MRPAGEGPSRATSRRPLRLAHRGDHRAAPENSLAAISAALAVRGIDGVEFDVRASEDRVPILLHDATLERVQGRPQAPAALTAAELEGLGVPSLSVVLDLLPRTAFLDIELKEDVVDAAVPLIAAARGDPPAAVAISSFDAAVLAHVRVVVASWTRWLNAERLDSDAIALACDLGCAAVSAGWRSLDERSVGAAVAEGLEVAAWTVTSVDVVERLAALGVGAICVEGEALGAG